jgi:hypothetical protein
MNLADALTERIVTESSLDNLRVWACAVCGAHLCYYLGRYHFVCSCHDARLEKG